MGRDGVGARSVNLSPSERPEDVYLDVSAQVEKQRRMDAERGLVVASRLDGFITRKVVKQTVMTAVYGVTMYGAHRQISRRLLEAGFPAEEIPDATEYIADKTFLVLREMFSCAKSIQDWLSLCGRVVGQIGGRSVEWNTPLGFRVVQPYTKTGVDSKERFPDVRKQSSAMPPNFVHSLDSTHMMMTALECRRAGLTFVSVHDSYWTHATDIPTLSRICREQFVKLHSREILKELSSQFISLLYGKTDLAQTDHAGHERVLWVIDSLIKQYPKGDDSQFDLNEVLHSQYFFS